MKLIKFILGLSNKSQRVRNNKKFRVLNNTLLFWTLEARTKLLSNLMKDVNVLNFEKIIISIILCNNYFIKITFYITPHQSIIIGFSSSPSSSSEEAKKEFYSKGGTMGCGKSWRGKIRISVL